MNTLDSVDAASLRTDIPAFRAGDTVKVNVKVVEGTRSRVQAFQGVVIARVGGGVRETFTVRKISFGVGVERRSPPTHRRSSRSRSSPAVTSVAPSCTTSASCAARRRRSRRSATSSPSDPVVARLTSRGAAAVLTRAATEVAALVRARRRCVGTSPRLAGREHSMSPPGSGTVCE